MLLFYQYLQSLSRYFHTLKHQFKNQCILYNKQKTRRCFFMEIFVYIFVVSVIISGLCYAIKLIYAHLTLKNKTPAACVSEHAKHTNCSDNKNNTSLSDDLSAIKYAPPFN